MSSGAVPTDVTEARGERVPAYQDGMDDSDLYPSPLLNLRRRFYYPPVPNQ